MEVNDSYEWNVFIFKKFILWSGHMLEIQLSKGLVSVRHNFCFLF